MRSYPRSFRRLLTIGFALVAIPAAIGLVSSAVSVAHLADKGERAVYLAASATRGARRLGETLTALERNAHQYSILGDAEILEDYAANRRRLAETRAELERLELGGAELDILARIAAIEEEVRATLERSGADDALLARFDELGGLGRALQQAAAERIDRETETLRESATQARTLALSQLAALLPVIAFLVIGFAVLIGRPIRQLDEAIRRLGRGQLGEPIAVSGPDDLEELGRRLEWMRSELVSLEREKNRFMREIAHALKTPLTALREGTELLHDGAVGALSAEQREVADILRRHTMELQELIEGLLQFGAAQFGRTGLDLEDADPAALVRDTLDRHALALRSRGLTTQLDLEPMRVRLDALKIKAILDNLISNAIKYSPEGGQLRVRARRADGRLVLEVADDGPGIAEAERPRIFDPFVQGRAVASGPIRGSGIGLSIVREHALAHGGSVELLDSPGGAHFRVSIPVEAT